MSIIHRRFHIKYFLESLSFFISNMMDWLHSTLIGILTTHWLHYNATLFRAECLILHGEIALLWPSIIYPTYIVYYCEVTLLTLADTIIINLLYISNYTTFIIIIKLWIIALTVLYDFAIRTLSILYLKLTFLNVVLWLHKLIKIDLTDSYC